MVSLHIKSTLLHLIQFTIGTFQQTATIQSIEWKLSWLAECIPRSCGSIILQADPKKYRAQSHLQVGHVFGQGEQLSGASRVEQHGVPKGLVKPDCGRSVEHHRHISVKFKTLIIQVVDYTQYGTYIKICCANAEHFSCITLICEWVILCSAHTSIPDDIRFNGSRCEIANAATVCVAQNNKHLNLC